MSWNIREMYFIEYEVNVVKSVNIRVCRYVH